MIFIHVSGENSWKSGAKVSRISLSCKDRMNIIKLDKDLANLDKNHFLANARKKFLRDNDANLINSLAISSTLRRNKQNEISIRLTREIDIRKSFSRNETMRPDEIREGHRKEIRTIQPILDTWTA
ncbi:hypothetical protein HGM15179_006487 [Zosterops borbonicus]|uniref:Uncharacterized protein n=1 Tax=Zosterops borbonicus TaxID=364589 RepID=A0A8K1GNF4_9PASS|nr:hypothetical protein HGM15179_006487 [Zosterops borbonicus]